MEINSAAFSVGRVNSDGLSDVKSVPVPARSVWEACRQLVADVAAGDDVTGLGIASTGPIDMAAGITGITGIPDWETGFEIGEQFQKAYPAASIAFAYSGVCYALAEQRFGDAGSSPDALAITVGTQVSAGIIVGSFTAVGRTGNAGHIGHLLVPGFDDDCVCGSRGCLEAVASEPAALRWARDQGWPGNSAQELLDSAAGGDAVAQEALQRAGTALGRAIASATALLDVDYVVVGGTLAAPGSPLWGPLGDAVVAHSRQSFQAGMRVVPSQLGALGVLLGAGILAAPAPE
ncbi:MAG: ROK family protein [Mycobacteriaceae bacterium]|nr:ROK family protein [Mycobacteriaceae bacterium]